LSKVTAVVFNQGPKIRNKKKTGSKMRIKSVAFIILFQLTDVTINDDEYTSYKKKKRENIWEYI
jgi:hypothetical protein